MNLDHEILLFEEQLKEEENKLNLLEEQLYTSRLLIKEQFGDPLPDDSKEYIQPNESAALPNDNKPSYDSSSKEQHNDEKLLLNNHISYIEMILQCKKRINELKHDIIVLKNRKQII